VFLLFGVMYLMALTTRLSSRKPPRWALFPDAAEYAGIPVKTLRDWVRKGRIPAYRIGPRLLQIDLNDIDRMRRRVPTAHLDDRDEGEAVS
jgi:excisionase family DNA binding protein